MKKTELHQQDTSKLSTELEFVGFWHRFAAAMIDILILGTPIYIMLTAFYGDEYWTSEAIIIGPMDFLLNYVVPLLFTLVFWIFCDSTPGKMAISAKIVDVNSGEAPTLFQYIGRYFGYIISLLPLCLGFFWTGLDKKKQGWHDKLAETAVVKKTT